MVPACREMSAAERRWNWTIVGAYSALVLGIVPCHEPWRDEAHHWLIARDASLFGLFDVLNHDGYPPFWHLMQMPFAKLGLPFVTLGVLNAACAISAVVVLVRCSPFSAWQKVLIAFSDRLLCFYGMVWRCYALITFALFLLAAVYPSRHRRPLWYAACVLVLASGHVLSLGVAVLFFVFYAFELVRSPTRRDPGSGDAAPADGGAASPQRRRRAPADRRSRGLHAVTKSVSPVAHHRPSPSQAPLRRQWGACLIMAVGIAILVLLLRQPPDVSNQGLFPLFKPEAPLTLLGGAMVTTYSGELGELAICLAAFVLVLLGLRRSPAAFWLVALTFAGWSYVFTFKNMGPFLQHFPLLMVVMIVACWLAREDPPRPQVTIRARLGGRLWRDRLHFRELIVFTSLAVGCAKVPDWLRNEVMAPFSGGYEAALAVRQIDPEVPIATYPSSHAETLLPYLPQRRFWHIEVQRWGTYTIPSSKWDEFQPKSGDELLRPVVREFPGQLPWLLLGAPLPEMSLRRYGYEAVYRTVHTPWYPSGETFWLYRPAPAGQGEAAAGGATGSGGP